MMHPSSSSPYSYHPRFSPREPIPRFHRSPYQNFPSQFYSPSSSLTMHWTGGPVRNSTPRPPAYNQTAYHQNTEDFSSCETNILDSNFIPLNSSANSSSASSFDSPGSFSDYSFHGRNSRSSNSNRKPAWKSPGGGGRWSSSPNDFRRNRPHQESNYSPDGGNANDVRMYISAEFLQDPWEHLQPKKPPNDSAAQ